MSARSRLLALSSVVVLGLIATVGPGNEVDAVQAPVNLGTASSFAVLAASTVTNTGPSIVTGDLGLSPGSAVTGFPPGIVVGTIHVADAVAAQAQADATIAYNMAAGPAATTNLTGQDLGGLTLTPGVYVFSSAAQLTGTLTLDAQGDPNAAFIFQIGSTLLTASASSVVLINGASPCNVFFQVGSSATLGTGTNFAGTIVALASVTANTGAIVNGRLFALTGAVTLDTNVIPRPTCATVPPPSTTTTTTIPPTTTTISPTTTTTTTTITPTTTTTTTTIPPTTTTSTTISPTTTIAPSTTQPIALTTSSDAQVGPGQPTTPPRGLPTTGSSTPPIFALALGLVALGAGTILVVRRRDPA